MKPQISSSECLSRTHATGSCSLLRVPFPINLMAEPASAAGASLTDKGALGTAAWSILSISGGLEGAGDPPESSGEDAEPSEGAGLLRAGLGDGIPAGRRGWVRAAFGIPGRCWPWHMSRGSVGTGLWPSLCCPGVTRTSLGWPGLVLPGLQRDLERFFLLWVGRAGEGGKESELNSSFSLSFLSLCL